MRTTMGVRVMLFLLVVALPRLASADGVRVGVVPGIAVNLDTQRVDRLSQDLAEALRDELAVDAIGGLEVRRMLPDEGLPPDCVATPACVDDVARRLSAQQLLFVVMVDTGTGGAIQVDSTWIDPATNKTASRPAIDIVDVTEAKQRFAGAARQLLPDAPVREKLAGGIGRMSEPVPRHFTTVSYITAGIAVVGFATGTFAGFSARTRYQECSDLADRGMDCSPSRRDSIRSVALAADIGWVVALGGAVTTAVLYLTSGEKPHLIVEPVPGGAAVSALGSF